MLTEGIALDMYESPVLTVPELAGLLRVSTATVYRSLHKWPHMRIGTEIRFTPEHVERLIALLSKAPTVTRRLASTPERKRRVLHSQGTSGAAEGGYSNDLPARA